MAQVDWSQPDTIDFVTGTNLKLAGTAVSSTAEELNALDGLTATVGELNLTDQMPASISFAAASAAANVCEVTVTVLNAAGVAIAAPFMIDLWLSDAATGVDITGTTASGTVTAKAASGVVIDTFTAKKALKVQTLATGIFTLEITDSAKTTFYVAAGLPSGAGTPQISAILATGDYGA